MSTTLSTRLVPHITTLAVTSLLTVPAFAQNVKKPAEKIEDDVVFDNTKPEKPAEEDDSNVVFDNRSTGEVEEEDLDNAPTFATTSADAASARAARFRPGFHLDFQVAFALPGGQVEANTPMALFITGVIGGGVGVGYRFTPNLIVALDLGAGYVLSKNCEAGFSCSGFQLQGGPQAQWRFLPFNALVPWVGLGFGYEYLSESRGQASLGNTTAWRGFKLLDFRAGVDFLTARTYAGPFVGLSMGRYSTRSVSTEGLPGGDLDDTESIDDPAIHRFLSFGLHGMFE